MNDIVLLSFGSYAKCLLLEEPAGGHKNLFSRASFYVKVPLSQFKSPIAPFVWWQGCYKMDIFKGIANPGAFLLVELAEAATQPKQQMELTIRFQDGSELNKVFDIDIRELS